MTTALARPRRSSSGHMERLVEQAASVPVRPGARFEFRGRAYEVAGAGSRFAVLYPAGEPRDRPNGITLPVDSLAARGQVA